MSLSDMNTLGERGALSSSFCSDIISHINAFLAVLYV